MQSAGPIRIVTSYRYMANGRNTASRFYLTVQEVPDLQNRLKRRFNLICQPAVQRTFIRAYLRCDRRFAASPICNLHLQTFIRNHHDVEQTGAACDRDFETAHETNICLNYGDLKNDPEWDPLRKDSRFDKLLAELAPHD